jgi:hypothetical protein
MEHLPKPTKEDYFALWFLPALAFVCFGIIMVPATAELVTKFVK